ncbi:ubiquinol-cytochrome-c reductase complex assembly factor 3 [Lepisosteus oculatus]|uniref:ubiquinol-cytochrome-c reductase complex assembly factor 3 n=1 Tax=Lepisosteus oculatus TaxID=7918 RepID=UPI0007400327|nr:PREDICTED: ubiquinol-cytochrome-c reductase complex assembly factor 3 [Lepisosteus oculatus]
MSSKWIIYTGLVAGAMGTAVGLWMVTAPGENRRREILKNLPESNPVRLQETRRRNALELQVLKEAAETNDNVARRFGK